MTEEQFWFSNPRIIKVYEKAWKAKENRTNELIHLFVGQYGLSALYTAIDGCLNGPKAKAKYMEKPIRIFELTEEDKIREKEQAQKAFMAWASSTKSKYKGKGG